MVHDTVPMHKQYEAKNIKYSQIYYNMYGLYVLWYVHLGKASKRLQPLWQASRRSHHNIHQYLINTYSGLHPGIVQNAPIGTLSFIERDNMRLGSGVTLLKIIQEYRITTTGQQLVCSCYPFFTESNDIIISHHVVFPTHK